MDIMEMMKMALKDPQAMQRQAMEAQAKVASIRATGSSGGGMVKITLNGLMELISIEIAPEVINPSEASMLNDLIIAAHADAIARIKESIQSSMLPGLGF